MNLNEVLLTLSQGVTTYIWWYWQTYKAIISWARKEQVVAFRTMYSLHALQRTVPVGHYVVGCIHAHGQVCNNRLRFCRSWLCTSPATRRQDNCHKINVSLHFQCLGCMLDACGLVCCQVPLWPVVCLIIKSRPQVLINCKWLPVIDHF